jgi:hypothetical protein
MAKPEEIVIAVNEIITHYTMKVTLRQVYYRLVAAQVIDNNINSYKRLSKILTNAREEGEVDPDKFEDRGRYTEGGDSGYDDVDDFMKIRKELFIDAWKNYRRLAWAGQDDYVEVWVEKDALASQMTEVAGQYGVLVSVARGYSSFTFLHEAVERILDFKEVGRVPQILYFGDFDPSGQDMVRDLGARLDRYGIEDAPDMIRKVALTPNQIEQYQLPPAPTKEGDSRAKKFIEEHGDACVELDALDPPVLREIVRRAILGHVNSEIWNANQELAEREKIEVMTRFARIAAAIKDL